MQQTVRESGEGQKRGRGNHQGHHEDQATGGLALTSGRPSQSGLSFALIKCIEW